MSNVRKIDKANLEELNGQGTHVAGIVEHKEIIILEFQVFRGM